MFDHNYLALRLLRLNSNEAWSLLGDGLCFVFPKIGVGEYVHKTGAKPLTRGDILVWEGCPEGNLRAAKGAEFTFWTFSLRLEHLFPLFSSKEISLLREVTDNLRATKYLPATSALAVKCHQLIEAVPSQNDLDHRSYLLQVAIAILKEEFKAARQDHADMGQVEERIITIFEELSADQLISLSVDELAVKFGCCRRHLNRLFHQYFGFSVGALKTEMRLLKAVSLLRDSHTKVINVADECGFNHLGLFNNSFKKRFGVSPGKWRNLAAEKQVVPGKRSVPKSAYALLDKSLRTPNSANRGARLAKDFSPAQTIPQIGGAKALPNGVQHLPLMNYPKAVIHMRILPPRKTA
jgi:AraC-like DNA-binding protein